MFRADSGRAVGRAGFAVEAFVDGVLDPLSDLQVAGYQLFGEFVFTAGDIQFIAHFFKYRADAPAFAALHTFLKFLGGFEKMFFGLLFAGYVHIHSL